jgi:hypothetical protein
MMCFSLWIVQHFYSTAFGVAHNSTKQLMARAKKLWLDLTRIVLDA